MDVMPDNVPRTYGNTGVGVMVRCPEIAFVVDDERVLMCTSNGQLYCVVNSPKVEDQSNLDENCVLYSKDVADVLPSTLDFPKASKVVICSFVRPRKPSPPV